MRLNEATSLSRQLLECTIGQSDYLIDCANVREVIRLPALTEICEGVDCIAGLLNLRGEVVEVIDARALLDHTFGVHELSDKIIILEQEERRYGLLVQNTRQVRSISEAQIENRPGNFDLATEMLANSVVHTPDGLFPLLNTSTLSGRKALEEQTTARVNCFFDRIKEEDRSEFCARAEALMMRTETEEGSADAFAVIELAGELYGIALDRVTEFLDVAMITPVPCCPDHIVGNANWRGDVLTVIEISSALQLPGIGRTGKQKVVVFGKKRDAVGVLVDAVYDVCHVHASQILPSPTTLQATGDGYLTGVAEHRERRLGILCVDRLLGRDQWCVREIV